MQVNQESLNEALKLSEEIISNIELSTSSLSNCALKASRLARLLMNSITKVPLSAQKFASVYENLTSENSEDWSNAVHSCRRILQDTADVIYPAREDKTINLDNGKTKIIKLGVDNYLNRIITYVDEQSDSKRFEEIVGSQMKYLGERLDAIFKAAQKGSHNIIISRQKADRYVIYTYLIVGDLLSLVELQKTLPISDKDFR